MEKLGKKISIVIVCIFVVIGAIIVFLTKENLHKITAFKTFLEAMWPYISVILGGVAITGVTKEIMKGLKDVKKD